MCREEISEELTLRLSPLLYVYTLYSIDLILHATFRLPPVLHQDTYVSNSKTVQKVLGFRFIVGEEAFVFYFLIVIFKTGWISAIKV